MKEIFNLNWINIFTTSNDYILFAVNQINESIFIHHSHIASVKPAFLIQNFCSSIWIFVVFNHNARSKYCKFSNIPLLYFIALFINNLNFPAITRNTNCTNFVIISNTKVNTSWTNRFRQSIVCIVIVMWEIFFPVFNKLFRNWLSTNVH